MKVALHYGRDGLVVDLPDDLDVRVIRKRPMPVIANPGRAVTSALANPVASAPLAELARGRRSACILICDVTRPVPNHLFLRPMIQQMLQAGIPAAAITVIVATGLHRANEGDELAAVVGDPWVQDTVRVENHFATDADAHVDLGRTRTRGTPVKLDRRFVDAELRIATGLVEPHFMAGFSGGRKVIAPGIAHEDTIRTFHNGRFMADRNAVQCNLRDNPLHEEQLEIVRMLGDVYALNTVIDEERDLAFVNFGEVIQSHLDAVAFAHAACTVEVGRKFSTLLTSAAGYPLDRTYYQTVKGMVTPLDILAPDASLVIAADCSEGIGSDDYRRAQQRLLAAGPDDFLAGLFAKDRADTDEWQTQMLLKPMRQANIHLYSKGLAPADYRLTGVDVVASISEAVLAGVARSGDAAVAVIPEGPYVVPRYVQA